MMDDIRDRYRGGRTDYTREIIKIERQPQSEPPKPTKPFKKPKKTLSKRLVYSVLILVIVAGSAGAVWWHLGNNSPLPEEVVKSVNFPVYYPEPLPQGYALDQASVKSDASIVFYTISKGSSAITFSEQAAPANPPDFDALQKSNTSFKKISLAGGQAIYGISRNLPVAIILTNTTLVNVSGTKNVPLDTILGVAQMSSSL